MNTTDLFEAPTLEQRMDDIQRQQLRGEITNEQMIKLQREAMGLPEEPVLEPTTTLAKVSEADRFDNLVQKFQAERDEVVAQLGEAKQRLKERSDELLNIDGAVARAQDRQRLLSGSKGQYVDVKAQAAAAMLMGETVDPATLAKSEEAAAGMTATDIEAGLRVLNTRRAEVERSVSMVRSDVRRFLVQIFKLDGLIAACRYESLRSQITGEFVKLTAAQDSIRELAPHMSLTANDWQDFCLPSAIQNAELKEAWVNPHYAGTQGVSAAIIAGSGKVQAAAQQLKLNAGVR